MRRPPPALALLPLLLALGACARGLETDQARLCRMALPALTSPDAALEIDAQTEDADGQGVRVAYRDPRAHDAHCRFARPGRPLHSTDLVSLALDDEALAQARLFFLIRFWLATPEGRAADPLPLGRLDGLPQIPREAAYGLQQALNALPATAIYALLASAFSLVYGLIGRIHFAFGALAAAGGYGAAFGAALTAGGPPAYVLGAASVFAVAVGAAWGLASGVTILAPLREASGQRVLVATVGLTIAMAEFLRLTQSPNWVGPVLNAPFGLARAGDFVVSTSADNLLAAGAGFGAALALWLALRGTAFGRQWRAYADDALAASLFGVDLNAVFVTSVALGGALAGLAGFTMTMLYGAVGYQAAAPLALKALTAAILGGIGSVGGALLGALLLGLFEALWSAYLPIEARDIASYALLAAVLALRPGGLLGAGDVFGRRDA